ncbi:MAG TPA: nucleotidyltransferase family protein [Rhodothermales bacterium]|nr:nucleotidyltransferase family protein [Rhodothermales bacterium]
METAVTTKVEVFERLHDLGPELRALGVARLGLFGSFLSGDAPEGSNVDILVEFLPGRKTFDNFMTLAQRLEDALQRPVELITRESLSPHIGPRILETTEYVSLAG